MGVSGKQSSKKTRLPQTKGFRIFVLVASVLLSVIVSLVSSNKLNTVTVIPITGQQVTLDFDAINIGISLLLGCSTFIIIELIALVVNAIDFSDQKNEYDKFIENINEYSTMLHEINNYYYEISKDSHGSNDLFVTYAKKEIEKLNNTLRVAAKQKEFGISSDYILNATGVFDAFSVSNIKTLKMTFPVMDADDAIFISPADSHFFEVLQKEAANSILNQIQVILILEKESTLVKDCVKKLLDFFAAEQRYECKVCMIDTFRSVCDTNGISSQFVDFGIYGDKMLFVAEQYVPIHKGTYSKDINRIRLYTRLFDEIWGSDILAQPNSSQNKQKVTIGELIKLKDPSTSL